MTLKTKTGETVQITIRVIEGEDYTVVNPDPGPGSFFGKPSGHPFSSWMSKVRQINGARERTKNAR